jgi:U3 small nucleolar RNA-associated protein 7
MSSTGDGSAPQMLSFSSDQEVSIPRRAMDMKTVASLKRRAPTDGLDAAALARRIERHAEDTEIAQSAFYQGKGNTARSIEKVRNPRLRGQLREGEEQARSSVLASKRAQDVLLPSSAGTLSVEGMGKTWQFRQADIVAGVQESAKKKHFKLEMPEFGPYSMNYSGNGRHLLLGGRKGHLTLLDWHSFAPKCEFHVKETIRAVQVLHNETMFAVAQKKYVHIYDDTGMELHVLKNQLEVNRLDFLPYHYLLTSISKLGTLRYQDMSTGEIVAEHRTRMGDCDVMRQNPSNAVMHLGHTNGTVSLWSPTMTSALVKVQCHNGPITSLCVDRGGNHMVTAALDGQVKVWDLRKNYRPLHTYFTARPAAAMDLSQSGLLALGFGPHVQVWANALSAKQPSPYMAERFDGNTIRELRFCPYEDVLGVGHGRGFTSLLVPGAGEANYDSYEANPFETTKQRGEKTVRSLLEKLQPSMITLDPRAFSVMAAGDEADAKRDGEARAREAKRVVVDTVRQRKHDTSTKRALRKRTNIVEQRKEEIKENIRMREEEAKVEAARVKAEQEGEQYVPSALDRFKGKK